MHVALPLRIRPSRTRLLMRLGVLCFTTLPLMLVLWGQYDQLSMLLSAPGFDGGFFVALFAAGYVIACALAFLSFVLEALPGAPFRHIDVDASGVTVRHWFFTRRILHRDIDGWGVLEREFWTKSAEWPTVRWRGYVAVAGRGVSGGQRVHPTRRFALQVAATAYSPLLGSREQFASLLAGFLSDCKGLRGPRAVADVPGPLASQIFSLKSLPEEAAQPARPKKPRSRLPGRFPTNEDKAGYWRGQAFQAMRAADDDPAFDHAASRADVYSKLARRDRKRRARERREARAHARSEHGSGSTVGTTQE